MRTEEINWTAADTKRVLLRAAFFMLVFFGLHVLMLWLHPLGAHAFLANLVLGAIAAWLFARRLRADRAL
jgi:hypothetical protein